MDSVRLQEENKAYASFYTSLNNVITKGQGRGHDMERLLEEQVIPLTGEFALNLSQITRTINREVPVSHRPVVNNLARELDRMLKEHEFTEERFSTTVTTLLNSFKALKGVDYLREQFERAQRTEVAEENYREILSLFKSEIEGLKQDMPELKGVERLDLLLGKLDVEGVELFDCKGWVNLVQPEIKVIEVQREDAHLKELIGVIGGEFKKVYARFPELKNHVSVNLMGILESEVLAELIEGASIEKLKEIIVKEVSTVRVDDVYQYENSRDRQTIFELRILIKSLLEELTRLKTKHGIEFVLDEGILALLRAQILEDINI